MRSNYINPRNYREPFLLIKWTRNKDDGMQGEREFSSYFFYGSIIRDRDLSSTLNQRPESETLSVKILNTSFSIEPSDLLYRDNKVYEITHVDKDQFNKQEQLIKAQYLSELDKQQDLKKYLNNKNKRLEEHQKLKLASVDYVDKEIAKLNKTDDGILENISQLSEEDVNIKQSIDNLSQSTNQHIEALKKEQDSKLEELKNKTHQELQEAQKENNAKLSHLNDEKTKEIQTTNQNLETLKNDLKTQNKNIKDKHDQDITSLQAKNTQINKKINELNSLKADLSVVEKAKSELQSLSQSIKEASDKIVELKAYDSSVETYKAQNAEYKENVNKKLGELESMSSDQNKKVDELKNALQTNSQADAETLKKFNKLSEEYIAKNAAFSADINNLNQKDKEHDASIQKFNDALYGLDLQNRDKTLKTYIDTRDKEISDKASQLNTHINNLETQSQHTTQQQQEIKNTISEVNNKIKTIDSNIQNLFDKSRTSETKTQEIRNLIPNIDNVKNEINNRTDNKLNKLFFYDFNQLDYSKRWDKEAHFQPIRVYGKYNLMHDLRDSTASCFNLKNEKSKDEFLFRIENNEMTYEIGSGDREKHYDIMKWDWNGNLIGGKLSEILSDLDRRINNLAASVVWMDTESTIASSIPYNWTWHFTDNSYNVVLLYFRIKTWKGEWISYTHYTCQNSDLDYRGVIAIPYWPNGWNSDNVDTQAGFIYFTYSDGVLKFKGANRLYDNGYIDNAVQEIEVCSRRLGISFYK